MSNDKTVKKMDSCSSAMSMQNRLDQVAKDIEDLKAQGFDRKELQVHIDKLHEYNELKDVGQIVLGQLATLKGVRTKDLYTEYGLELND